MKHPSRRPGLAELPPEDITINVINVFETGDNTVRAGIQLADLGNSVGAYAICDVGMNVESQFERLLTDDDFLVSYQHTDFQDIAVEIGSIVRRRTSEWRKEKQGDVFLQSSYILDEDTDFVFGKGGELFRRSETGLDPIEVPGNETILAMDGLEPNLIAVGSNGSVYRVSGDGCRQIDVGIGTDFRTVMVDGNSVFLGGDFAMIGRMENDEFLVLESELEGDVLTVCKFNGKIYIGDSEYGVSAIVDNEVVGIAETGYIYRLNPGRKFMTCASGEYIFQFDGQTWRGLELTFDGSLNSQFADMTILD